MVNGTVRSAIANIIGWRLRLWDRVMEKKTLMTGWTAGRTLTSGIITAMVRGTINVHWTQRRMRRMMTTFVDDDRWRRASPERPRRTASGPDLRRWWESNVSVARRTTRICTEDGTIANGLQQNGRTREARGRRDYGTRISRRMHVLWTRGSWQLGASSLRMPYELKSLRDDDVAGIEFAGAGIGVDGVGDLVIATLVQSTEGEPHFGDVGVDADGSGISVEGVAVLVDLEV